MKGSASYRLVQLGVPVALGMLSTSASSAVAEFGLLLRQSPHRGADWSRVVETARAALGDDREGYRAEFVRLVDGARGIKFAGGDQ